MKLRESVMSPLAPPRKTRVGAPPGELRLPDEIMFAGVPRVTVTTYDQHSIETTRVTRLEQLPIEPEAGKVLWIAIEGLADLGLFRYLQRTFGIHPLAIEDTLSRRSRPKTEAHHNIVNVIAVDPMTSDPANFGEVEIVSLFLGENWVISIEDSPGDTFEAVRHRLKHVGSRLRRGGADTLLQALIDTLVDRFFPVLDTFAERLEELDETVGENTTAAISHELHEIRQALQRLRRYAWPMREAVNALTRSGYSSISDTLYPYLMDVSDHLAQVIDQVEMLRELATAIRDLHFSALNMKMNEIIRGLTVVSTIFLPLTFLAGMWGMNFKHMPELDWKWAYPAVWITMISVGIAMYVWFKRKRWA
jgi:magnesium transporter